MGSSPRRRGKAFSVLRRQFRFRITPAWAGKRGRCCPDRLRCWDHPRVGGEKSRLRSRKIRKWGSPPRRRGKGAEKISRRKSSRITPAWAGKSGKLYRRHMGAQDHPRVGGEKSHCQGMLFRLSGSPPRGRGKIHGVACHIDAVGITPAWAGKRGSQWQSRAAGRDHPRVGGEKTSCATFTGNWVGSPPHGRGKDVEMIGEIVDIRITPAWAGKSASLALLLPRAGDHPRMGGEK